MTEKEKAKELVERFRDAVLESEAFALVGDKGAKECALICQEKRIELIQEMMLEFKGTPLMLLAQKAIEEKEVKKEIEKL